MNEQIYLGFAGKYNVRLGESLMFTSTTIDMMKNIYGEIDLKKIEENFSNIYNMYKIDQISKLSMLVSKSLNMYVMCVPTEKYKHRKNLLDTQKYEDYIISFTTFEFLNEKVWPKIVSAFIDAIQNNNNSFIFNIKMPFKKIDSLYQDEEIKEKNNMFIEELKKWLSYQIIGELTRVSEKEQILDIGIRISY